jgi:hypothetical protein
MKKKHTTEAKEIKINGHGPFCPCFVCIHKWHNKKEKTKEEPVGTATTYIGTLSDTSSTTITTTTTVYDNSLWSIYSDAICKPYIPPKKAPRASIPEPLSDAKKREIRIKLDSLYEASQRKYPDPAKMSEKASLLKEIKSSKRNGGWPEA